MPKEQMQLRLFTQKQRQDILHSLCYALRVKSTEDLPKVFQLPVAVALASEGVEELATRFDVPQDQSDPFRTAFETAMRLYCKCPQYGHALLNCDHMYTIDMEPAGTPGQTERDQGRALVGLPPSRPVLTRSGARQKDASEDQPAPQPKEKGHAKGAADHPLQNSEIELQTFSPEQRNSVINIFCDALSIAPDSEELPAFLRETSPIPLKVGSRHDLIKRFGVAKKDRKRRQQLRSAFQGYCRNDEYLRAIINTKTRFTIDMKPDKQIKETHRQKAIEELERIAEIRRKSPDQDQQNSAP